MIVKLLTSIALIYLVLSSAQARTVYITDEVDIPIRSEKTFEDNIIRSAPSGTQLQILQTDNDGWTKIQLEDTVGWVISRYISNNPPAREELSKLQQSHERQTLTLKQQNNELIKLRRDLKTLTEQNKNNKVNALKAISEKKHIEQTYTDALKIEHENATLKVENLNLKSQIKLLTVGDEASVDKANRIWFLYGGILVILSLLLGFIFARLMSK